MNLSVVILAAGNSNRMLSSTSKVLHPLAGVPLLERVVTTASSLEPKSIHIVYSSKNGGEEIQKIFPSFNVKWVEQKEPMGTGHAVLQAMPFIEENNRVLVLYGDVPLISKRTLLSLLEKTSSQNVGIVVAQFKNPTGLGRIIRNDTHNIVAIVEERDATDAQRAITEINTGILTADAKHLKQWLPTLKKHNRQGEYYLTDIIELAIANGCAVESVMCQHTEEVQGVNDRVQLIQLERFYQQQLAYQMLERGVTVIDPQRFDVRGELVADKDVIIDINVIIEGKVVIGKGSRIGPSTVLRNVTIGKNVTIKSHCDIEGAVIGDHCDIGPFARIRPGTKLDSHIRIGNFVEIKNTNIGEGSKANHLSYLGDAVIGRDVNVGAGTITCNYDGVEKHQTIIKDNVFIGSDTQLVAPVVVGENAYIGAGSTITKDAPPNELTLSRAQQCTVKGWVKRKKEK